MRREPARSVLQVGPAQVLGHAGTKMNEVGRRALLKLTGGFEVEHGVLTVVSYVEGAGYFSLGKRAPDEEDVKFAILDEEDSHLPG